MNQQEYTRRVLETESKPATLKSSLTSLDMFLAVGCATGEVMNRFKRVAFYGKPIEKEALMEALGELAEFAMGLHRVVDMDMVDSLELQNAIMTHPNNAALFEKANINNINLRLLHGAIGEMSETAEKMEALRKQLMTGEFDLINYSEEMGDCDWYGAIQKDELQILGNKMIDIEGSSYKFDASEEAIRARNIAKLEKRNKGRTFNAEATIDRDTAAERIILEQAAPVPESAPIAQSVALEQAV